ncbi:glycosyltransferase family 4 protein [Pontibacter mangrovi]|uniref:Glycosyltransferase family 4 protein n=1 Tax=Pontibacter mangrovi TaxID=2589816 RepID=A0A501VQQ0_9BACT|nr:glycosyltransferase family 4 protein [Pontibacter mangrovi]TPE39979.1 glycosyltransferase family 4 protein [Pontibacter mangrovi]
MKNILYLSFFFEPDLSACSFRNSSLAAELAKQVKGKATVELFTTKPNRYSSFKTAAPAQEVRDNLLIHRLDIPVHKNGFSDQVKSFWSYFSQVRKLTKNKQYDLVFASSSKLFTAYLGYTIAKKQNIPLYLDIRDIFIDTIEDVVKNIAVQKTLVPVFRRVERKVFSNATHINLISEGFKGYFTKYGKPSYSSYPNGIDDVFLSLPLSEEKPGTVKTIMYAGNIGEGQGLHKIVPQAAAKLGKEYKFVIIGDGGAKQKLLDEIVAHKVNNVELRQPVQRKELIQLYGEADFLFIHLNDYKAFEKVLPSKVFELGTFDKPVIAGVAGYASKFIDQYLSNKILFKPCDVDSFVKQLKAYRYKNEYRKTFIENFKRETINKKLSASITSYIK